MLVESEAIQNMLPLNRILFPTDFSARCTEMLATLKALAVRYKAEVTLLHVVNPIIMLPESAAWSTTFVPVPERLISRHAEQLERFGKEELDGLAIRRLVFEGDPAAQIVATAQTEEAQLVIMPTHGYGVFRRFLIGSVTAKVLHDLGIPILTGAHSPALDETAPRKIANIVCAVDLGPRSYDVLNWAARLASDFHASFSTVHVLPYLEPSLRVVFSSSAKEELEASVRREIHDLHTRVGARQNTICIEQGQVAASVCAYAKSVGADLLVIGRGGTLTASGHLRQNAYSIIRESGCPVLSV